MSRRHVITTVIVTLTLACVSALAMIPSAHALPDAQQDFTESSGFTIPNGVTSIEAYLFGGNGGSGDCGAHDGVAGHGAITHVTFDVTPNEVINIHINSDGGHSANDSGFGGGSTDIRQGGDDLVNRIAVAGGGGGGGCGPGSATKGGDGGDAGQSADDGQNGFAVSTPPSTPDLSDAALPFDDPIRGLGGQGATLIAAGIGGVGTVSGGNGGQPNGGNSSSSDNSGGAGGGGYYGGGAGASEPDSTGSGAGGGGAGSSFIQEDLEGSISTNTNYTGEEVLLYYTVAEEPTTTSASATTTTTFPAPSGAYGSSLTDTTNTLVASPGGDVVVHGKDFKGNSDVNVDLHSTPVRLGTVTASASGAFVHTFTLPKNTALGLHQIVLTGLDGNGNSASATLALNVVALPETGANAQRSALWALGIMLVGIGGLVLGRRRKLLLGR